MADGESFCNAFLSLTAEKRPLTGEAFTAEEKQNTIRQKTRRKRGIL